MGDETDEQVVMRGPGLVELARGRDALVKSYADFMTRNRISLSTWNRGMPSTDGAIRAVARFDWSMVWNPERQDQSRVRPGTSTSFQQRDARWVVLERVMHY